MCVNYAPVQRQLLRDVFGVEPPAAEWKAEAWPDYPAPIVRASDTGWESVIASFSLVPKSRIPPHVRKYDTANAKVETIGTLRSYSGPWKAGQLCLIPATGFYEPNYESGKAVRWRIGLDGGEAFAIAGLWRSWPDGAVSFTMPTANADSHPLLKRFHAPGKEKRGIVILPRDDWEEWLTCRDPERARTFLRLLPPDRMVAEPAPVERRPRPTMVDVELPLQGDSR